MALIGHWPLDGRLDDVSGNGLTLTNNSCNIDTTKSILSASFQGIDRSPGASNLRCEKLNKIWNQGKTCSMEVWVYIEDQVISEKKTVMQINGVYISIGSNKSFDSFAYGPDPQYRQHGTLEINKWYHLCLVIDTGTIRKYINGVKVCDEVLMNPNSVLSYQNYGDSFMAETVSRQLLGNVNNAKIYDHALSDSEVIESFLTPSVSVDFKNVTRPAINVFRFDDFDHSYEAAFQSSISLIKYGSFKVKFSEISNQYPSHCYVNIRFKTFKPNTHYTVSGVIKNLSGLMDKIGSRVSVSMIQNEYIPGETVSVGTHPLRENDQRFSLTILTSNNVPPNGSLSFRVTLTKDDILLPGDDSGVEIHECMIEESPTASKYIERVCNYMEIPVNGLYMENMKTVYDSEAITPLQLSYSRLTGNFGSSCFLTSTLKTDFFDTGVMFRRNQTMSFNFSTDRLVSGTEQWVVSSARGNTEYDNRNFIIDVCRNNKLRLWLNSDNYVDMAIETYRVYNITLVKRSTTYDLYIDGKKMLHVVSNLDAKGTILFGTGKFNGNLVSSEGIAISDFSITPCELNDEQVKELSDIQIRKASSYKSMFEGVPTLDGNVPRLWVSNPNSLGERCFIDSKSVDNRKAIPIGWGGDLIQPDLSEISFGCLSETHMIKSEVAIFIDNDFNSHGISDLSIKINEATTNNLILVVKEKF